MKKHILLLALALVWLTGVAQPELLLKGNIVLGGDITLTPVGTDKWQSEVTLDDRNVFLFSDKYVYFDCPSTGYRSDHIRINGGTYTVTFNMANKSWTFTAPTDEYRISAFGSSVCNGQGATGNKGYAWLYGEQLKERKADGTSPNPFYVSGLAIGGNTTRNLLDRYDELTRNYSRYVIIGLSMGNEGVHEATNKDQIVTQFSNNMQTLIRKMRNDGMVPVVMNNYTRGDFTPDDYAAIKRMNLMIHEWDVPSVNTLGAIDDGAGHWASGYQQDNGHPTTNGHKEFFYAMTPSLFDAIAAGKPQPRRDQSQQMTLSGGDVISFRGEGTVHPFTVSLRVKGSQAGRLLTYRLTTGNRQGGLSVDAEGHVVYTNTSGRTLASTATLSDDEWHTVTLTHYYAQTRTLLYIDGESAGELRERISSLGDFTVGDAEVATTRQLSELFFWRAALSPDEVQAVVSGKMLKSSLELYVPTGSADHLENLATSLNTVTYIAAATALHSVIVPTAPTRIFNLAGVAQPCRRGFYIENGQKHIAAQ